MHLERGRGGGYEEGFVSLDDLKARVCAAIDARRDTIVGIAKEIATHPETGYREFKTAKVVANAFREFGLEPREGLAVTGVRADLPSSGDGPTVAILGELDALVVADNPRPTRRPARSTPAATTPRSAACSGPGSGCSNRASSRSLPAGLSSSPCRPRSTSRSSTAST
jgi:hypothetical protein